MNASSNVTVTMMHLVLLLMLTVGVSTTGCPAMCTCRQYPRDGLQKTSLYYTSVSCSGYVENATSSLGNTTRDFQVADLNQEELVYVLDGLMENQINLPYLNNLIITKSQIENLNLSVESLERILSLTLTDNRLKTVPEVFLNLSNLQSLDLSRNEIKVLELEPFRTLRTLEVLNLSANSLTKIDSGSFSGLNNLKCLDLSRNNLITIDDQALTPLTFLQYLNLSNNRLEVLDEACFSSLIMLQQLDVSWNRLARVAPGSLQLPSLARLLLAGNPQLGRSREAAVLVGTGRRLQTVDASRTGLKQVPAALTHSIRTLRLAGNSIRTVSCGDLDSYPLLQLLDFTSNDLESVEEDALGRLDYLSVLYLTDNNIHEIPRSLPEKLKVLHLEHNGIQRVSGGDLQGLTGLEVLLLSDNKIRAVDEAAFSQLVSLVTLDLSRNPVSILRPGCLEGPSALQVLRLSSIGIISPAEEVSFPLTAPEHLITLDLSDSPGLARQLLADTAALAASRELQELDLSRTGLQSIRSDLLHYLTQLRVLHVKDNSLNCSGMEWLAAWMRRQNEPEYGEIVCSSPPDLWGTPLVDLQDVEISPVETINQRRGGIDGKIINLQGENITNMYETSGNSTGQYTTDSTNYISLRAVTNITTLMDKTVNDTRNVSSDASDSDKGQHSAATNEIEKVSIRKNKIYFGNKRNNVNIKKSILTVKKQPEIKNEILVAREDIKSETISASHSTAIPAMKNDSVSTPQETIDDETTTISHPAANSHPINITNPDLNLTSGGIGEANETAQSRKAPQQPDTLIGAAEKKIFNNADESYGPPKGSVPGETAIDVDMTENSQPWNVSTGEMSMYTNNKQEANFPHPGMLILAAGAMGAAAAFAMLAARFTRKRRSSGPFQQEDIEVSSLPSVTELW